MKISVIEFSPKTVDKNRIKPGTILLYNVEGELKPHIIYAENGKSTYGILNLATGISHYTTYFSLEELAEDVAKTRNFVKVAYESNYNINLNITSKEIF